MTTSSSGECSAILFGVDDQFNICSHGLDAALAACKEIETEVMWKGLRNPPPGLEGNGGRLRKWGKPVPGVWGSPEQHGVSGGVQGTDDGLQSPGVVKVDVVS